MKCPSCISATLLISFASIAALAVACKPASESATTPSATVDKQIDKAESAVREAAHDMKAFTYAQRTEFVAAMEKHQADLNRSLDELAASIARATPAVRAEAAPKLAALRAQSEVLAKQLAAAKDATPTTWDTVKATTNKAYDDLSKNFQQARQWLSEKIAP